MALTRAKCLLIVFGDPHTLHPDSNWQYLLNFCYLNGCYVEGKDGVREKFVFPEVKEETDIKMEDIESDTETESDMEIEIK